MYEFEKNILRYPRLDTVIMVEKAIQEHGGETRYAIWKKLPKKVMYQTYNVVVEYLLASGKIAEDRYKHICWIWNPKGARYYYNRKDLAWRRDPELDLLPEKPKRSSKDSRKASTKRGSSQSMSSVRSTASRRTASAASRLRKG